MNVLVVVVVALPVTSVCLMPLSLVAARLSGVRLGMTMIVVSVVGLATIGVALSVVADRRWIRLGRGIAHV